MSQVSVQVSGEPLACKSMPTDSQPLLQVPGQLANVKESKEFQEAMEWDVHMPCEVVSPAVSESLRNQHNQVAVTLRRLCKEVEIHAQDSGLCTTLASLIQEQPRVKSNLEEVLVQGQGQSELGALRALTSMGASEETSGISLTEEVSQDTFLHTRTVSLPEVKRELPLWKDAAEEELRALFERTRACEKVTEAQVQGWIREGQTVHVLPGKAVCTRKAGVGKRRFRAVVCGNHLPSDAETHGLSTFASGVESISVRAAAALASRKGWSVSGLDIRTAFLNAPARASSKMRLVVRPPRLLVDLKLIPGDERWLVSKALYGLTTSPKNWAVHRDEALRKMVIPSTLGCLVLKQGVVDENVWKICDQLLWLAGRSRADLAYSVGKCSQWATKSPGQVVEWSKQIFRYLKATKHLSLVYGSEVPALGEFQQLQRSRSDTVFEVYADASHAPQGDKSQQCTIALWNGDLICWDASRQPFTALSSAQAELICMLHSMTLAESVGPLFEEFQGVDIEYHLYGDNAAACRAFEGSACNWRSRHLRIRAAAGRERIQVGTWHVMHISGEYQVADLATKPLSASRLEQLLSLMNVKRYQPTTADPVGVTPTPLAILPHPRTQTRTNANPVNDGKGLGNQIG